MTADPLPATLEAATLHLERWKWCWKLTSYLDNDGHRSYRALVYRPDWPPGFGRRKQLAGTPVEALKLALQHAIARASELKRLNNSEP